MGKINDKKNIKNKNVLLVLIILLLGIIVTGATYAFFNESINVKNKNIVGNTSCFNIIDNFTSDSADVLFPVAVPNLGKKYTISLKVNPSCQNVTGTGSLYLHLNGTTSNRLLNSALEHCENKITLETKNEYKTSSSCQAVSNLKWVTNGTAIKYAVFDNLNGTGTPLSVGNLTSDNIGNDILLYSGFDVTGNQKNYYIFIWMDGYLTDNSYINLTFDSYVYASVVQK